VVDRIAFIFVEALQAMRRNVTMSIAAISTCGLALFLLGGISLVYVALDNWGQSLSGKFEMRAYLKDSVKPPEISKVATEIRSMPGVKAVFWIPRDKAWEREKVKYPKEVSQGLENPLPDAFKIVLSDLNQADAVEQSVQRLPEMDPQNPIQYLKAEQELVEQSRSFLRWLAGSLGALLLLTAGVLIYNAIRMTVFSRRREARIMRLVGASLFTVRVPYMIEGTLHGLAGGALACFLLWACQLSLQNRLATFSALGQLPPFPAGPAFLVLGGIGALYGFLASWIALWVPMKS